MGSGAMIPKPTDHIIPPDVWRVPVHSAGLSPRHRLPYSIAADTGVHEIGKVSGETESKNGCRKYRRKIAEMLLT